MPTLTDLAKQALENLKWRFYGPGEVGETWTTEEVANIVILVENPDDGPVLRNAKMTVEVTGGTLELCQQLYPLPGYDVSPGGPARFMLAFCRVKPSQEGGVISVRGTVCAEVVPYACTTQAKAYRVLKD